MEQDFSPIKDPVVSFRDLTLSYGKVLALDHVSLDLPSGTLIGLIGPDGVGKSTLLSLITGAHAMQEGSLTVLGGDMRDKAHRNKICPRIAYMPQGLGKNLYFTLTVEIEPNENAGTVLFDGKENSSMRKRVEEGKTIVLSAEPSKGYAFSHYEDGASEITNAEYSVVMNKKRTVTAVFKKAQGLDDVTGSSATVSQKVLINGTIYILRGDKIYTLDGQAVK